MSLQEDHILVDEFQIGLDRSTIDKDGKIELPQEASGPSSGALRIADQHADSEPSHSHNIVDSIKTKKHHAAIKIRKTLHISKASDKIDPDDRTILAEDADEQSDSRLVHEVPQPEKTTLKDVMHNPVETVKSKISGQGSHEVAANMAAKEVSHGTEVDLINAYAAIDRATTEKKKLLAIKNLSGLMRERQSTFARWTLDRHVTKVRELPKDTAVKPTKSAFEKVNAVEGKVMDWHSYIRELLLYYAQIYGGQYIGYGSSPPTPSKETIMPNMERLLIASSPMQEFIMTVRRVYRWESTMETMKYLIIFLSLWYLNLLIPGSISVMMYMVIERHIHGNSLEDLREDVIRRENTQRTALSITEYIVKEGDEKWADELLQALGPWLMIQLADMANFFESLRNFYEWRVPHRTLRTLILLGVAVPFTALVPLRLLVKAVTLSAGITFFAFFPIATNFPEYRLLVSPSKRLLWNIPTHGEWAVRYIQAEGSAITKNLQTASNSSPKESRSDRNEEQNYGSYVAHEEKITGRLVVLSSSIRFEPKVGTATHWAIPYDSINILEKNDRLVSKNIPPQLRTDNGQDLRIATKTGEERVLKNLVKRDEIFSQIIGFSPTNWQITW